MPYRSIVYSYERQGYGSMMKNVNERRPSHHRRGNAIYGKQDTTTSNPNRSRSFHKILFKVNPRNFCQGQFTKKISRSFHEISVKVNPQNFFQPHVTSFERSVKETAQETKESPQSWSTDAELKTKTLRPTTTYADEEFNGRSPRIVSSKAASVPTTMFGISGNLPHHTPPLPQTIPS